MSYFRDSAYMKEVAFIMDGVLMDCPNPLKPMMEHLRAGKGKNLRAALVVETGQAMGRVDESLFNLAASVELLHLSTLIHDDVIDKADTRRGLASLQKMFGPKMAVLSGDFLFTKCFGLVAGGNRDRIDDFVRAASLICQGETMQHQFCKNYDMTEKQYFKIIAGKTAAMFAFSMYAAAMAAGGDKLAAQRLLKAGYYMGMAFQMIDDCLDYSGDPSKVGKTLHKDLREGVVTYPLIYALSAKPELKSLLSGNPQKGKLGEIAGQVKALGGVEKTRERAGVFYRLAACKIRQGIGAGDAGGVMGILDSLYYREA